MPTKYGYTKKGFTQTGYTAEQYDNFWSAANLRPWRPRIQIYDHQDNRLLLHEYDSFSNNNDIGVEKTSCSESVGSAGNFSVILNDDERNIDITKVGNACKVVISMAKQQAGPYVNIHSGFVENLQYNRDTLDGLQLVLTGFGSAILTEERLTDFKKTATRLSFGSSEPDPHDPTMKTYTLFKALLTETDHLVSSPVSIAEQGNYDLSLLSNKLDTFIPSISVRNQPAASVANNLTQRDGSFWGVNAYDQVWAWRPGSVHSGVTLKTFKKEEKDLDIISETSYFYGPWNWSIPINQDTFGNVLIAFSGNDAKPGAQNLTQGNPPETSGTALATTEVIQQVPVTIPDITDLSFLFKRVGNPGRQYVSGVIYGDDEARSRPSLNNILGTFLVDISRLQPGAITPAHSTRVSKVGSSIITGQKAWLAMKSIGPDDNNTIMWMNAGLSPSLTEDNILLHSGTRPVSGNTANSSEGPQPFTVSTDTVYNYATFYNTRTRIIVSDPISIKRYGQVEKFIDITWTSDFKTIHDTLIVMLQVSAKPPMNYSLEKVTIPNPPFQVGKNVTLIDDKSGLEKGTYTKPMILGVGYDFDAYDQMWGVGTYFCDLQIGGIYDYLTYEKQTVSGSVANALSCRPPLI